MKKRLLALVLGSVLMTSSCLGPNHLFNSLINWNADVSRHNWINEALFVGLVIVPVYQIALIGDVLVFNTIAYWGENPINEPGTFPASFKND